MKTTVSINIVPGAVICILIHITHHLFGLSLIINGIQLPQDRIYLCFQSLVTCHSGLNGHIIDFLVVFTNISHCQIDKLLKFPYFRFIKPFLGFCVGQTIFLCIAPIKAFNGLLKISFCLIKCLFQLGKILVYRHFTNSVRFFLTPFPVRHHSSPP